MQFSPRRVGRRVLDWLADRLADRIQQRAQEAEAQRAEDALSVVPMRGTGVKVNGSLTLTGPASAAIGNNVHLGDGTYIRAEGGLVIGDNTHISRNVSIYTISHEYEGEALPYDRRFRFHPVTIGRDVWIGRGVHIAPGARIGDGAIVKMGAVVEGVVPPGAIVAPPKAQFIRSRDPDRYVEHRSAGRFVGAHGVRLGADEVASFVPSIDAVRPFFVASTGRAGSRAIAHALSQHPDVTCLHEPRTQFIRLSAEWAHGLRDPEEIQADLDAIYSASVSPGPVFGESDHNLSVLLDPLLKRVHEARVVWLIRDGRAFVASAVRKGWYGDGPPPDNRRHVWDDYRLQGDLCGDVSADTWASMSAFEKNCWYWSYINRAIAESAGRLGADRWRRVRLESIADEIPGVFDLLGVDRHPVEVERLNAGRGRGPAWSDAEVAAFEHWCGAEMDRWYPEWRGRETEAGGLGVPAPTDPLRSS